MSQLPHGSRLQGQQFVYDSPNNYISLDELATTFPTTNENDVTLHHYRSLESVRQQDQVSQEEQRRRNSFADTNIPPDGKKKSCDVSRTVTELYTISYLILFSFLGTLARLGLQAIAFYPGAPIVFSEIWANFGGCVFMGFLSEDRMLFKNEWGTAIYDRKLRHIKNAYQDEPSSAKYAEELEAAKRIHAATKKTIPLYIGLSTGLCGCFTSFSSFIRDVFLALSNTLSTPQEYVSSSISGTKVSRNGGYSFMAVVAVIIATVAICISGLFVGAHIAVAIERFTPSMPYRLGRKILDPLIVLLAFGCWLGAVILAIFPPDRYSTTNEIWRGRAVFALVFAPLGCLGRFYASLWLNGRLSSFPLGTFMVNVFGTIILGMCWDLQHVPLGGVVGCQVLQGIEDGFCGCLTTVSTWVAELVNLRRGNAYRYGAVSVIVALCFLIVIMGSMKWTIGFRELLCTH